LKPSDHLIDRNPVWSAIPTIGIGRSLSKEAFDRSTGILRINSTMTDPPCPGDPHPKGRDMTSLEIGWKLAPKSGPSFDDGTRAISEVWFLNPVRKRRRSLNADCRGSMLNPLWTFIAYIGMLMIKYLLKSYSSM
jgi:hypothetical protein